MVKVDLRVMVQVVPPQDVISRDNVSVKVNAVLYFASSIPSARDHQGRRLRWLRPASWHRPRCAPQCSGKHELDEMLRRTGPAQFDIQEILDQQTDV